jgi:hypothetical protein
MMRRAQLLMRQEEEEKEEEEEMEEENLLFIWECHRERGKRQACRFQRLNVLALIAVEEAEDVREAEGKAEEELCVIESAAT